MAGTKPASFHLISANASPKPLLVLIEFRFLSAADLLLRRGLLILYSEKSSLQAPHPHVPAQIHRRNAPIFPAPPEAMTGMPNASDTALVSFKSKPSFVPSASMLVSRISPASKLLDFLRPSQRPNACRVASAMRVHFPFAPCWIEFRINRHNDTLRSELPRAILN